MARFRTGFSACCALSLALTLLLGSGVLFGGKTFTPTDFLTSRWPWNGVHTSDAFLKNRNAQDILEFDAVQAVHQSESLARGELMLWDPHEFCGWPAAGDPQLGTFYLPRLVLLRFLPPLFALDLLILLHFFGAGLAMYALAREWGMRETAAVVSSLTWLLCGPQCVWFRYAGGLPAAVYLPLLALAIRRGLTHRRLAWIAGAGALWSLMFLSAHPQLSFLALVWAAASFAVDLHRGHSGWTARAAILFGVAGAGLASIQLFPFLESIQGSQKSTFSGVGFSKPDRVPLLLITLFWQRAFGSPFDRVDLTPEYTGDNFFNLQCYMGLLPLLLAVLAWKRGRFLWILSLACLALATSYPLWLVLRTAIPFLKVADPHRLYLFAFAISLLSGLGLEELLDHPSGGRLKVLCGAASAAVVLLGLVGLIRSATWISLSNPAYIGLATASLFTTGAIVVASSTASPRTKAAAVCCALLGDLLPPMLCYNGSYDPLPPAPPPLAEWPRNDRAFFQVASNYHGIEIGNFSTVYGFSTPEGYGSQYPKTYGELAYALGATVEERRVTFRRPKLHALYFLDVGPIFREEGTRGFMIPQRAWLVGKAEEVPNAGERLDRLSEINFPMRKVALLEEGLPLTDEFLAGEVIPEGPGAYRTRCNDPRLLVISENYHPGWRATVDGAEVRILRADHTFQAIPLPAGEHRVTLAFRPKSVTFGMAASAATAFFLGALAVASRLGRKNRGGNP